MNRHRSAASPRSRPLRVAAIAVWIVLAAGSALAQTPSAKSPEDLADLMIQKNAAIRGVPNPQGNVGGEDLATAVVIPSLPFDDSGNTCTFVNDYDEACPYTGSGSPDVVYRYSPAADDSIHVRLCDSGYDTKLYVYENSAANLVACNDDGCGADGFRSQLEYLPLTGGSTYYIVVDGYFGDCGAYAIEVEPSEPCQVTCQPGWVAEGEPICGPEYVDQTNGGCNSSPPVFSNIDCGWIAGYVLCGEYGGFTLGGLEYRDTDWYEFSLNYPRDVVICVEGTLDTILGLIDGNAGCGNPVFLESVVVPPCQPGCVVATLPAGVWWAFVATSDFGTDAGACGSEYVVSLDGVCMGGDLAVDSATWSRTKEMYRAGTR